MYNYEKEVYCCDNCGKEMSIYCGWMNGLCSECWIEEIKESEYNEDEIENNLDEILVIPEK